jgi:hypothetical protein
VKRSDDPLGDALTKVKRAKRHVKIADVAIHNYVLGKPYEIVMDRDTEPPQKTAFLRILKAIPDEADEAVFTAIQNLRSALDYIAWAVASRTGTPASPEHIAFPFFRSKAAFEQSGIKREIEKAIGSVWYDFVAAHQPYPGGNDVLCALNVANRVEKHRLLMHVGGITANSLRSVSRVTANADATNLWVKIYHQAVHHGPLYDGMNLVSVHETSGDPEIAMTFQVALREVAGFETQPAVVALNSFAYAVESVLGEARNIFWP